MDFIAWSCIWVSYTQLVSPNPDPVSTIDARCWFKARATGHWTFFDAFGCLVKNDMAKKNYFFQFPKKMCKFGCKLCSTESQIWTRPVADSNKITHRTFGNWHSPNSHKIQSVTKSVTKSTKFCNKISINAATGVSSFIIEYKEVVRGD